ncbi:carboxylesterase family protein [Arthrobacter citreus]|uniref:Carboxylesterase family protein n=1 Tax=Arthrobacter citreus TaxID=1670 RepID=A0ABZ2ZV50_9MICC
MLAEVLEDVPVFPQLPSRLSMLMGPGVDENPQCPHAHYLNVFAPDSGNGLPVVVFLHGGAWATGGGAVRWYRGTELADRGMVVVTVNYRIGPAGHLGMGGQPHRPLEDLVLALGWVRANIRLYGGNADNITLAGQSAGAWYAWALARDGRTRGWLRRVALWSMPEVQPWSYGFREKFTRSVIGVDRTLPVDQDRSRDLLRRTMAGVAALPPALGMMPQMLLPAEPGPPRGRTTGIADAVRRLHVEQVYIRNVDHEMSPFLALDQLTPDQAKAFRLQLKQRAQGTGFEALPDRGFRAGAGAGLAAGSGAADDDESIVRYSSWLAYGRQTADIAAECARRGISTVLRSFAGRSMVPGMGSPHCFDLPFQFGNLPDWFDAPMLHGLEDSSASRWSSELGEDLLELVYGESSPKPRILGL